MFFCLLTFFIFKIHSYTMGGLLLTPTLVVATACEALMDLFNYTQNTPLAKGCLMYRTIRVRNNNKIDLWGMKTHGGIIAN